MDSDDSSDYFNDDVATFGDRVEASRSAKGLSQKELADRLGVKKKTVVAWENDISAPRSNKVQILSGLLNVSMVWLITGKSDGTDTVAQNFDNRDWINGTLAELKALRRTYKASVERIDRLEARLLTVADIKPEN